MTRLAPLFIAAACAVCFAATPAKAIGILVANGSQHLPMELTHHRVEVTVNERGAKTKVTQEFKNPTGRQLEATYLFPLPQGASIDSFALWMNGKKVKGEVLERQKARQIYESIVRRAQDPGLIEYVDAQLFQARVFPVPANGTQKVELVYSHLVDYDAGTHKYIYPMKTDAMASRTLDDFTFTVKVNSKLPIKNLYSPTHKAAARVNGNHGVLSFEKGAFSLAEDFVLLWSVDDKDVGMTLLTYNDGDEPGYFMLLASPSDAMRDREIIGKRVSFVVDTSGSMAGEKMDATKEALSYCLGRLGHDDLFNIVSFGGFAEAFSDKMLSASRGNVNKAKAFVDKMEPLGGTNIDEAMQLTFANVTGSSKVPHMVVFLTDGRPTVGETETKALLSKIGGFNKDGARLFVFGVGDDVNTVLLDKMADEAGGMALYTSGDATLKNDVQGFYDRISHPVLSDLSLAVSGVRVFGTHPRKLGHLFRGGQLVVLGRYRDGGKAKVTLSGTMKKGPRTFAHNVAFAKLSTDLEFIPRLWAQRQVGMLLAEIRDKGEQRGLVDEVTQLATRFGIVTPYTSYLVVEPNAPIAGPGRPLPEPVFRNAPRGGEGSGGLGRGFDGDAEEAAPADDWAAPPPASAAAPRRRSRDKKGESLRTDSGKAAVRAAKEIGSLRQGSVASKKRAQTEQVARGGRSFTWDGSAYVDGKVKRGDREMVIKPFSDAYFLVLKLRPDLKAALSLGGSVKVSVGKGRTLVVGPQGKDKVDEAALKSFLRR